jgi:hypothetical protein
MLGISKLLNGARKSIVIIDGYLGANVLNLLTEKAAGITVNILTKPLSPQLQILCSGTTR